MIYTSIFPGVGNFIVSSMHVMLKIAHICLDLYSYNNKKKPLWNLLYLIMVGSIIVRLDWFLLYCSGVLCGFNLALTFYLVV